MRGQGSEEKQLTVRVPEQLHTDLKEFVGGHNTSLKALVTEAVRRELARRGKRN